MELLDIYNGKGEHIGKKERGLVHKDGDWHKTFHCWIIFQDGKGNDCVILQKRSENKKSWAGFVDISAAGHLESGETMEDGLRELEEELGVKVEFNKLLDTGIRVCVEEFKEGTINHEYQNVFFLIDNRDIRDYKLQGEELSGILCVKIDDLLSLFSNQINEIISIGLVIDPNGNKVESSYQITRDKFIPTLDNYYYKVMILAKRILHNEKHFHI